MKRILLATVAAAALSFPAFAAPNNMQPNQNQPQQSQQQKLPSDQQLNNMNMKPHSAQAGTNGSANSEQMANAQQSQRIKPSQLGKQQIKQMQMSLNKKGFDARNVDGIWGPRTRTALRNFEKQQNINAHGRLTRQALSALGVNVQNQNAQMQNRQQRNAQFQNKQPGQSGTVGAASSETTGQGSSMGNSATDMNQHNQQPKQISPDQNKSGNMKKPNQ